MRRSKCVAADPDAVDGCRPDFCQWHPQDLKEVRNGFRGSAVTYGAAAPLPPGQQRSKGGFDPDNDVRHLGIVPAQDVCPLEPVFGGRR